MPQPPQPPDEVARLVSDHYKCTWIFERRGERWYLISVEGRAATYFGSRIMPHYHVVPDKGASSSTWDQLTKKILGRYLAGLPVRNLSPYN